MGTSYAAFENLGASMSIIDNTPYFSHPCDPEKMISVVLDTPHMIKLVRNAFASLKVIVWEGKGKASWFYIEQLEKLQSSHGLALANKISKRHIDFVNQKMKVSLATQIFSKSVAECLRFLFNEKISGFESNDVLVTADFLELFNDLFDILNSRKLVSYGFKGGLCLDKRVVWEEFLQSAQSSLLDFHDLEGNKLICSQKRTGFLGFYLNITSVIRTADFLFSNGFSFLLTYKLCQDFLEQFFNAVRLRNGWNYNPTPSQFRSAFKKLLLHSGSDILLSSSANTVQLDSTVQLSLQILSPSNRLDDSISLESSLSSVNFPKPHCHVPDNCTLCIYVLYYISGAIAKYLHTSINCSTCKSSLLSTDNCTNTYSKFVHIKNILDFKGKGGLTLASHDLLQTILLAEKFLRTYNVYSNKNHSHYVTNYVLQNSSNLFQNLIYHSLYTSSSIDCHRLHVIRLIVNSYLYIKLKKLGKEKSTIKFGKRQKLTRTIIFESL